MQILGNIQSLHTWPFILRLTNMGTYRFQLIVFFVLLPFAHEWITSKNGETCRFCDPDGVFGFLDPISTAITVAGLFSVVVSRLIVGLSAPEFSKIYDLASASRYVAVPKLIIEQFEILFFCSPKDRIRISNKIVEFLNLDEVKDAEQRALFDERPEEALVALKTARLQPHDNERLLIILKKVTDSCRGFSRLAAASLFYVGFTLLFSPTFFRITQMTVDMVKQIF